MYRLLYQDGDAPQSYTFNAGEVTIGRSPEQCQIVLKDFGISRTHARITVDEDGVRIADLKSKNGTQVNGVPVVEAPLKDGDKILLGKFQLTFTKSLEGKVVLDEDKPLSEEAGTIIRSVGELSKLLTDSGAAALAPDAKKSPAPVDLQEIEKSNRILKVLTKVAETLIAVRRVEEVPAQVVEIVFDHIPADRGFLMLQEEPDNKLVPMIVKHRKEGSGEGKITVSKTIRSRRFLRESTPNRIRNR
jgi:pSer/pThr/pTyr-binding forkhead associated (FHA) protein